MTTSPPSSPLSPKRASAQHIKLPGRAKALLLLIAVGVGLAAMEVILRIFWSPVVTLHAETRGPHPDYGFAPLAGTSGRFVRTEYNVPFQHTQQRMRGTTIRKAERTPGTRARILFLGDSFTYSIGTEEQDSFTSLLARQWKDVEIINSGCTGYGQREELAVLDQLGAALKPDITVITFFWNDLEDILRLEPAYAVNAAGQVRRVSPPDTPSDPLRLWPEQRSYPRSKWKTVYVFELVREATGAARHKYTGLMRPRQITTTDTMDRAWKLLDEQFRLIKLRADELGTHLVVVSIPDYNLVNPNSVISSIKPLNFDVHAGLEDICRRRGIEEYNALDALQASFKANGGVAGAAKKPLYYEIDRHLTVEGNRVMAEYLTTLLEPMLPPAQ
jgi:hypothetical protein